MAFKKGKTKTGGRKTGVSNKIPNTVRDSVFDTFVELQKDSKANLFAWAKNNPTDFYKLSAKLIPKAIDVKAEVDLTHITGVQILPPDRIENN